MREIIALALFCLLVAVGSLAVAAWTAISGSLFTLDGLLLAAICLLLATVFFFCFLWFARDARLLDWVKARRRVASAPEPPEKGE